MTQQHRDIDTAQHLVDAPLDVFACAHPTVHTPILASGCDSHDSRRPVMRSVHGSAAPGGEAEGRLGLTAMWQSAPMVSA